jgi:polar amino acid transport system substrate-binding protein
MKRSTTRTTFAAAVLGSLLLVTACGDDDDDSSDPADTEAPSDTVAAGGGDAAACADGKTLEDGSITIATGDPAFPPYVIDDDPASGQGFEAALAMAVAGEMGFDAEQVKWIRTGFDAAIAPGEKEFDFNLQQYSISAERAEVVSFSDPYYTAPQAVIGAADSTLAIDSISDLKPLNIGVAAGTTSITLVEEVIQPDNEAQIFNSNADANAALVNGQIDVMVVDLPTALYLSAVEFDNAKVFGQFPQGSGSEAEPWGLLFAKDNPLVECANIALANLTETGALEAITTEWMGAYTEAPELSAD